MNELLYGIAVGSAVFLGPPLLVRWFRTPSAPKKPAEGPTVAGGVFSYLCFGLPGLLIWGFTRRKP